MAEPPSAHVAASIEVAGLLLAGLGGGAPQKRAETPFAPSQPEKKMDLWVQAVAGGDKKGVIGDLAGARDEPLKLRRDFNQIEEPVLQI